MVKKILLILISTFIFSSCAFFGSSIFPQAMSENIDWLVNGNITKFYILDNNLGQEYLFLVLDDQNVVIFDLSLNLRGYLENGFNGAVTDGLGFVDFNGDFIIGNNKISRNGSTDTLDLVNVMPISPIFNTYVFRWTDTLIDYYVKVDNGANIEIFFTNWTSAFISQPMPNGLNFAINQSNPNISDLIFADMGGGLYKFNKQALFDHADNTFPIGAITPSTLISNPNLTQWVTRCEEGFFVSTYNGEFILYDYNGSEINRIGDENNNYIGKIVTIDYDMEFYYYVDEDRKRIIKERLPF